MNVHTLLSELNGKIAGVRRLDRRIRLQAGAIDAATTVVAVWLVALGIEAAVGWDPSIRAGLWYGALALSILGALTFLLPPTLRVLGVVGAENNETLAHRIGAQIEQIGDRLVNTLQLGRSLAPSGLYGTSLPLAEAAIVSEGIPLREHDYTVIVDRRRRRRALLLFSVVGGITILAWLLSNGALGAAYDRLRNHDEAAATTISSSPFTLELTPADDHRVISGDSLAVSVKVAGAAPQRLWLLLDAEGAIDSIPLQLDRNGTARHMLRDIRRRTVYRAVSGPVQSRTGTVTVVERPEIVRFNVGFAQPAYTGRPRVQLPDNVGDVRGLRGSAVAVRAESNMEIARAWIVQAFPRGKGADTVRIPMQVDGRNATGGFRLTRDGSYTIEVESADGVRNAAPPRSIMSVATDTPPTIALDEPAGDTVVMEPTMLLPMGIRIADDFGFSRLRMVYRLTGSRYGEPWRTPRTLSIRIPHGSSPLLVPYIWNLTRSDFVPEDTLSFYLEVADNDVVGGPKVARTKPVVLRFPSLDETLHEAHRETQASTTAMEQMLQEAGQMRTEMDQLNRELTRQMAQNAGRADWQSKQKLQQLMQRQADLQQKMARMAENLRTTAERLQQAQAISPETVKKYQDLQKMFEKMNDPKLLEQMKRMQEQMNQMTPEQMAEAMRNYQFNEEQFRQSVERTMEILKRMQTEQRVEELGRRAEELARAQQKLNELAQQSEANDRAIQQQLAERQRELSESAKQLQRDAAQLAEEMRNREGMPAEAMEQAQQELQRSGMDQAMQQAGEQMQRGEMNRAQQQGEQAQQSAQQFQQRMQQLSQQMQQQSRENVAGKMRRSLQDLLELSRRQEDLRRRTESAGENSPQFRELARQQQQLSQQMRNLTDQMMSLGKQSFAVTPEMAGDLGDAMKKMGEATSSLEQRNGQQAGQQEGGALRSMNSAAQRMQEMLGAMQQGGQNGSMAAGMGMSTGQRLQQMAAQQQMINQAMAQQMGQSGQQGQGQQGENGQEGGNGQQGENGQNGNGNSDQNGGNDPNGQMRRLRQQQQEVQRSLEEINREARQEGTTRKNMVGDLEQAAHEIEEVLGQMNSGEITPETVRRQERILSRMLDAIRSARERDKEERRESRPGVDLPRTSPPELRFGESGPNGADQLPQTAPQQKQQGYTPAYESLIRRYFESAGARR